MSRHARFELVRSDAGHFARFIAANGREVWRTSEVYRRRKAAAHAIRLVTEMVYGDTCYAWLFGNRVEVRDVDERAGS